MIPAHVGLGSPHWDSHARGLISGLSFNSTPAHIARAAVDSLAFQVADIYEIIAIATPEIGNLFVDGGPSTNPFLMQLVAESLSKAVTPCRNSEASALGAALLAGLATKFWPDLGSLSKIAAHGRPYMPRTKTAQNQSSRTGWHAAIARTTLRL